MLGVVIQVKSFKILPERQQEFEEFNLRYKVSGSSAYINVTCLALKLLALLIHLHVALKVGIPLLIILKSRLITIEFLQTDVSVFSFGEVKGPPLA